MGLGQMTRAAKLKYLWEVIRYTFSLSNIRTILLSYGYFIHDQVLGIARIHAQEHSRIHPTASIRNPHNVYLGRNSHINRYCCIWAGEHSRIQLGDNLLMGPGVMMFAVNHGTEEGILMMLQSRREADIVVGDDVWMGAGAIILAGVHIADGCIVAAGAVVTKSISEENTILGGVPAKVVARRCAASSPTSPVDS